MGRLGLRRILCLRFRHTGARLREAARQERQHRDCCAHTQIEENPDKSSAF
jgi:hypothetical protein